jgi:hypothetical protein
MGRCRSGGPIGSASVIVEKLGFLKAGNWSSGIDGRAFLHLPLCQIECDNACLEIDPPNRKRRYPYILPVVPSCGLNNDKADSSRFVVEIDMLHLAEMAIQANNPAGF